MCNERQEKPGEEGAGRRGVDTTARYARSGCPGLGRTDGRRSVRPRRWGSRRNTLTGDPGIAGVAGSVLRRERPTIGGQRVHAADCTPIRDRRLAAVIAYLKIRGMQEAVPLAYGRSVPESANRPLDDAVTHGPERVDHAIRPVGPRIDDEAPGADARHGPALGPNHDEMTESERKGTCRGDRGDARARPRRASKAKRSISVMGRRKTRRWPR